MTPDELTKMSDRAGDMAVSAVGADDDAGAVLADLGSGRAGGVDEDLVEPRPAGRVGDVDVFDRLRGTGDRDRPEVEAVAGDRRATGRDDRVEQSSTRFRAATRGAWMTSVERVSLGNARSTASTR
jgi:hypothetical protein